MDKYKANKPLIMERNRRIKVNALKRKAPWFTELHQTTLKSDLGDKIRYDTVFVCDEFMRNLANKDKQHVEVIDDIIFYKGKIFIPNNELHERVMREHHDNPMAGHPGIGRTLRSIKRTYYWPTIENDVKTYVTGCQSCQRNKIIHQRRRTELHPHSIPEECWESISVDLIGPLPESKGCNAILAVIDRFSRMIR